MKKDMLARFEEMRQDAYERGTEVSLRQLCVLVLADVVEDQGIAVAHQLEEIDKSLITLNQNM